MPGKAAWTAAAFCAQGSFWLCCLPVGTSGGPSLSISPTFHHVLLVVTVIVTVSGTVVDVKSMDGSVVVAGWNILQRMGGRAEINRDVHALIVLGEEQLG